jgi:hypothetical protein
MDLKQLMYYWPLVFFATIMLYIAIEYQRYRRERRELRYGQPLRPPDLPDKLVLSRMLDQTSRQRSNWQMLIVLLLVISIPVLFLLTGLDIPPEKSFSELLQQLVAKLSAEPGLILTLILTMIIPGIAAVVILAMNKNERLVLDKDGISYLPPFRGLAKHMDISWSIRWPEVTDISLGRALNQGRLKIQPSQGKLRVLMPFVWQPVDESLRPVYKSLFSLLRFRYRLQHDIDDALENLPLLRYIQEKAGLRIDTGRKSHLEFDLLTHPRTRQTLVLVFACMAYALIDSMANSETYTAMPPVAWLIGLGCVAGLIVVVRLWDRAIPLSNVLGLAMLSGMLFTVAMYPGLLRLNQLTATTPQQSYEYHYLGNYRFVSDTAGLPPVTVKKSEYWDSVKPGEAYTFVLRQGGLGFYQLDMQPEFKKMRKWYCLQRATGDAKKASACHDEN